MDRVGHETGRTDKVAAVVGEMAGGFWADDRLGMLSRLGQMLRI